MKRSWLFSLLFLSGISVSAQDWIVTSNTVSSLVIGRDKRYDLLVAKQRRLNITRQTVTGYRVQIYFGSNRPKASEVKIDFTSRYPDVPAYLSYQQPNYKVRVGDFRSRFEAQQFLGKIEGQYPTMFIVPDEVRLPGLK